MTLTANPSGSCLRTDTALLPSSIAHNPGWQDGHALLCKLGVIERSAENNVVRANA
jgi:hypothetical protein